MDAQKKSTSVFVTLVLLVGAGGFEPPKLKSSRFTVCPHWPLGNTPISAPESGALDYYSRPVRKKQLFLQKNFCARPDRKILRFVYPQKCLHFVLYFFAGFCYTENVYFYFSGFVQTKTMRKRRGNNGGFFPYHTGAGRTGGPVPRQQQHRPGRLYPL